jgi:hypothetical protein
MSRQRCIVVSFIVLLLLALGLWFWLRPLTTVSGERAESAQPQKSSPAATPATSSPAVATGNQPPAEKKNGKFFGLTLDEFAAQAFSARIDFYGKVVDQFGVPVPDVEVIYNASTSVMDTGGDNSKTRGDGTGNIRIIGLKGANLYVRVSKQGYYHTSKSLGTFRYGTPTGEYPAPTKDNPFVFVLQKMGQTEPLIQISSRSYRLLKNGTAVGVDLATGQTSLQGDIQIEAWTNDQAKNDRGRYDWKCRISVPGGGLVEQTEQFAFEAPVDGYRPSDEIVMSQNAERWQPQAEKQYFLKLADGSYARIQFKMIAQGNHFFRVESYLNPTPGSRNLEYDPAKRIKP